MKSKFVGAYSVIAFVLLAIAVLWFGVSVFLEASRGSAQATRTFSRLCRDVSQHSYSLGFMSDAFIEELGNICLQTETLIAMTISSPAETFFAWSVTPSALTETERGHAIQRSTLFSKIIDASVDMGANASPAITVTASLRTTSSRSIFESSRSAFILVFVVLLSSIVVLIITPGREDTKKEDDSSEDSGAEAAGAFSWEGNSLFSANSDAEMPLSSKGDSEEHSDESEEHSDEKEEASEIAGIANDYSTGDHSTEDYPSGDYSDSSLESFLGDDASEQGEDLSIEAIDAIDATETPPEEAGFGAEENFGESLNAELVRAASSGQDVSILILRIFDLDRGDAAPRIIAGILSDSFEQRNIFEFGSDAYACIIPGATLDETMQTAEYLYNTLQNSMNGNGMNCRACIGISTRAGRTVPASKMTEEADTAARKAEEERRLPIVAFRANPQKYRDQIMRTY